MKMSNNQVKHEVFVKQYLRSILDISESVRNSGVEVSISNFN